MGKLDDNNDQLRPETEDGAGEQPTDEDTEGHLFLPNDPGTARAMAGDRLRDAERRARDRGLEREARQYKQGRTNR